MPNFRKILRAVTWEKLLLPTTNYQLQTIPSLTSTDVENCNAGNLRAQRQSRKRNKKEIKRNKKIKKNDKRKLN